jgi:hypothetical protein
MVAASRKLQPLRLARAASDSSTSQHPKGGIQ